MCGSKRTRTLAATQAATIQTLLGEACLAHEHQDVVACQHAIMVLVTLLKELHCRRQGMLLGTGGWLEILRLPGFHNPLFPGRFALQAACVQAPQQAWKFQGLRFRRLGTAHSGPIHTMICRVWWHSRPKASPSNSCSDHEHVCKLERVSAGRGSPVRQWLHPPAQIRCRQCPPPAGTCPFATPSSAPAHLQVLAHGMTHPSVASVQCDTV